MKSPTAILISFAIAGAIAANSYEALAETDLYEAMAIPAYQKAWNKMLAKEKNIDSWLSQYAKTKNGVVSLRKLSN